MGKHAVMVCGPAGSGKSTFCALLSKHCQAIRRNIHVVNLDPAAEVFEYPISIDIRELVCLDDVMEHTELGPNGGLVYCFEYLMEHMDWLSDQVDDFSDDFLIFDCPGQIELYSHIPIMRSLARQITSWGYNCCSVYLLDSHFITDESKFVSGTLSCLAAMVQLELPHVNVLSKCDLLKFSTNKGREDLQRILDAEIDHVLSTAPSRFANLDTALAQVLTEYSMVNFIPLDPSDEDSVASLLYLIDSAVQYGDDVEPLEERED